MIEFKTRYCYETIKLQIREFYSVLDELENVISIKDLINSL